MSLQQDNTEEANKRREASEQLVPNHPVDKIKVNYGDNFQSHLGTSNK